MSNAFLLLHKPRKFIDPTSTTIDDTTGYDRWPEIDELLQNAFSDVLHIAVLVRFQQLRVFVNGDNQSLCEVIDGRAFAR